MFLARIAENILRNCTVLAILIAECLEIKLVSAVNQICRFPVTMKKKFVRNLTVACHGIPGIIIEDCLFICPCQTLHILEDLSLYSQNLKYFGIPRFGTWSKCQFFSPTVELHVGEHSAFVNRQIIRLIQFSCNCAFLNKEELCKNLSKMSFFSEIPKYLKNEDTWRFYLYRGLLICKRRANLPNIVLTDYN